MDCDGFPGGRTVGDVGADEILHMQLALLLEQENRHRRKLFGHGADAKNRLGLVGDAMLPIGHAIAFAEKNLSCPCHQHGSAKLLGREQVI